MNTHLPGFQSIFRFLHHLVSTKLVTSSIRVKLNRLVVIGLVVYRFHQPRVPARPVNLASETIFDVRRSSN